MSALANLFISSQSACQVYQSLQSPSSSYPAAAQHTLLRPTKRSAHALPNLVPHRMGPGNAHPFPLNEQTDFIWHVSSTENPNHLAIEEI